MILAAMSALALVSCKPNDLETEDVQDIPAISGIVFNEVDSNSKVIELYNNNNTETSLEGVTIVKYDSTKEGGKSTTWTGAKGLKIAAHGWIYLESTDLSDEAEGGDPAYNYQDDKGTYVFKGGLSGKKNVKLELLNSKGTVLDTFIRGTEGAGWNQVGSYANDKDHSFSRVPDGTGAWVYAAPTKGAANGSKTGDIAQTPKE